MHLRKWHLLVVLGALLLATTAGVAVAQETGNVYVVVTDNEGTPLPGVSVTLSGYGAPRLQISNAEGQVRYLGLDPGNYQLKAELEGFSTVEYPNVNVRIGRSTSIEVSVTPAVEEVITVTSESPLLDERKIQQGTTVTQLELEKIPTARDPWSVLNQTPGVLSDRINVGGNESGQQTVFNGPGVSDDENNFMVDGVQITDMRAIGSSSTYYDFDQFAEMQFTTGGADVSTAGSGVSINLVTKRGTNDFRGSARFFVTDKDQGLFLKQSQPDINPADLGPGQASVSGNSISRIQDTGFEAGGPAKRDKLWFWGSHGENDIKILTASGSSDDTILTNDAFKANAQFGASTSATGSWNNGNKQKFGRLSGPNFPQGTAWNQRGPTAVMKAEATHVFNSNFYLTGNWSKLDGGFQLAAQNGTGPDAPESFRRNNGVWGGNFLSGSAKGPADAYKIDGTYFFNKGNTSHELKFGTRYREYESSSAFRWPGRDIFTFNSGGGTNFLVAHRGIQPPVTVEYTSLWAQDTLTFNNWTINAGFRYDNQEGANGPGVIPANPLVPDELPALNFGGNNAGGFDWTTISPRIGVTYALGEERKTLLRASISTFPDQLAVGNLTRTNPASDAYAYFTFDGDGVSGWDGEPFNFSFPNNYNPADPSALVSPNRTDAGLDPPITQELTLGVEHAFIPEFVVNATFTVRNVSDILDEQAFVVGADGVERVQQLSDYIPDAPVTGTLPDSGQTFSVPTRQLRPDLSYTGGTLLVNGGRERDYQGFTLGFTKRLANRWMARGYINYGDTEWSVPAGYLPGSSGNGPGNTAVDNGSDIDGGAYAIQSGGSAKNNSWLNSTWAWNLNGMYQVAPDRPWGFNVAANLYGREGSILPFYVENSGGDGQSRDVLVSGQVDAFRNEDITTVDLRLEKEFAATGNIAATLSLDLFNALNEAFVLQRQTEVGGGRTGFVEETLSPRIWRIGLRLNWR